MKNITNLTFYNDEQQDEILIQVAIAASSKAIRISQALGLTIHIIEDHKIIAIAPDNTRTVIGTMDRPKRDLPHLKKGTILVRRKV